MTTQSPLEIIAGRWPSLAMDLQQTAPHQRPIPPGIDWWDWWRKRYATPRNSQLSPLPNVLLLGLDCPAYLQSLYDVWGEDLLNILVLEPDLNHLAEIIERQEMRHWLSHPRFILLSATDWNESQSQLAPLAASVGINGLELVISPSLENQPSSVAPYYARLTSWIESEKQQVAARCKQRGRPLANSLANIHRLRIADSLDRWQNLTVGTPAFLIGAGPSLDSCLERLPHAARHGLIITVDTALRSLLAADVIPHIVVTMDPTPANLAHVKGIAFPLQSIVAWSPEVYRGVLDTMSPDQPTVMLPDTETHFAAAIARELGMNSIMPRTPQTGELAYHLAAFMGCDPIVLVGFDLAFSAKDGFTHARHAALKRDIRIDSQQGHVAISGVEGYTGAFQAAVTEAIGINGEPILIPTIFRLYRERLEELIAQRPGTTIDAGGQGAVKAGTIQQFLSEVLTQFSGTVVPPIQINRVSELDAKQREQVITQRLQRMQMTLEQGLATCQEFNTVLLDWPTSQPPPSLQAILEAQERFGAVWTRMASHDGFLEILEPALIHYIVEGLRSIPTRGKSTQQLSNELLTKNREIVTGAIQTLQGFQTFTAHAIKRVSHV